MAKVVVEFDTNDKTLSCSIDGKAVDNVKYVSLGQSYEDEDEFTCSISTMQKDEANDMVWYNAVMASESKEAQKYKHETAKASFDGFVQRVAGDEVTSSIHSAFGVK